MNATSQVATAQVLPAQIVMIAVECSMFGGYKRSSEQDIVDAGGKVPDTDILTKGGKHIFPSERLAPFGTVKKNVFKDLWKFGIKALGSGSVIAISADDLPEAERILEAADTEFGELVVELGRHYDTWLEEFITAQPTAMAGDIIRRAALTMEDAVSRFKFNHEIFMPTPVGKNGSIESMAAKLTSQLYKEVAQAAYAAWDTSFNPVAKDGSGVRSRRIVGQKAKSPLRNCRDKLSKLSFLDPNIAGGVTLIESVLAATQVTGWIEDTPSNPSDTRLYGLVQLMMDSNKFANAAEKIMQSPNVDADVDALCGVVIQSDTSLFDDIEVIAGDDVVATVIAVAAEPVGLVDDVVVQTPVFVAPAAPIVSNVSGLVVPTQNYEDNFF